MAHWTLPEVPVSAGALLFDRAGQLLILKPTYKSGWTIPGGVMEDDGETPWQACRREVKEETGLDVVAGRLIAVDSRPARPDRERKLGLRFLFHCGVVRKGAKITVQHEEASQYEFVPLEVAYRRLRPPIERRVRSALAGGGHGCVYLEDGVPVLPG